MARYYRYVGLLFALTGVVHFSMGLFLYRRSFGVMMARGLINTVRPEPAHQLAFWFTFVGLMMGLTGYLMDWVMRKKGLVLPGAFGYVLTGFCLVGIVLIPLSGFWLVLPQGVCLIIYNRQLR